MGGALARVRLVNRARLDHNNMFEALQDEIKRLQKETNDREEALAERTFSGRSGSVRVRVSGDGRLARVDIEDQENLDTKALSKDIRAAVNAAYAAWREEIVKDLTTN